VVLAVPANQCNRNSTSDLYTLFGDDNTRSRYKAPEATLQMNFDAGAVKLTSITGWRHSKENQTQDYDASSRDFYRTLRVQDYTQWSQELRAAGELMDGFDYVVGGYYFKSKYDLAQDTWFFGGYTGKQLVTGKTESYAAFGDFNWTIVPTVRLSFGGRWSHDNKKLTNDGIDAVGVPFSVGAGDKSFSKFTPKVGLDWRPNNDTMLYASWSRGYRSGGFSPRAQTPATASTPFFPETVDAYEIGGKFSMLDNKLQLNLAAYYSDYKDMQQNLTVPGGPQGNQTITSNVPGGASIKGIEFDATLRPLEGLRITTSAAYMKSHFRNFVTCGFYAPGGVSTTTGCDATASLVPYNYSANRLIYAPKFTFSLEAEYTIPASFGDVVVTGGWRHISPYDEQISIASTTPVVTAGLVSSVIVNGNDPRVRTVTQDLLDASVTFNFELGNADAYFRVFGRNLGDERTTTHAFTVAGLWSFGMALEPRTYGATIGVKF
jgi:iron complex outermembrane recepter protein